MNDEMLDFFLRDINFNLPIYIQEVLDDDPDKPDHSAVYVNNFIKCYINLITPAIKYSKRQNLLAFTICRFAGSGRCGSASARHLK